MPDPSPIDPDHDSPQIDAAASRYEQWVDPEPGLARKLQSGHHNNTDSGRWF